MFSLFQARFVYFPSSCLIFSCFLLEKSRSKWWKDAGMATSINPSTISSFPSPPHHQLYILHHKLWKYFFHRDFRDVSPSAHTSTAWFHSATLKQKGECSHWNNLKNTLFKMDILCLKIKKFILFIGPRSDHSLLMSVTHSLTHWLTNDLVEDWMNWPKYTDDADYADYADNAD